MAGLQSTTRQDGWPVLEERDNLFPNLDIHVPTHSSQLPSGVGQYHSVNHEFDHQVSTLLPSPAINPSSNPSILAGKSRGAESVSIALFGRDGPTNHHSMQQSTFETTQSKRNEGVSSTHSWDSQPAVRVPRRNNIPSAEWQSHRQMIGDFYISDGKTLEETMKLMENNFGFVSSKKQYKEKLKEWGLMKNIPAEKAHWMHAKAEKRKQEAGKATAFQLGKLPVSEDRILKSLGRTERSTTVPQDPATPREITYHTPRSVVETTPTMQEYSEAAGRSAWTPVLDVASPYMQRSQMLESGYSLSGLHAWNKEAEEMALLGNIGEAEKRYLDTLARQKVLLSPTHEETIATAYHLADLYAQKGQIGNADKVLNWVGEKHIEYLGAEHPKTILHLIHASGTLFRWSRPERAQTVLSSALETSRMKWRNQSRGEASVRLVNGKGGDASSVTQTNRADYASPGHDTSKRELLSIAKASVLADNPTAEALLIDLITKCEIDSRESFETGLEAFCALINFYSHQSRERDCLLTLAQSRTFFWSAIESCEQSTLHTFSAACTLAFHHVRQGLDDDADSMIAIIKSIAGGSLGQDSKNVVCLILRIARFYQDEKSWDEARPHFEHAWAISIATTGPKSALSRTLEKTCENQHYFAVLPETQDEQSNFTERYSLLFGGDWH